MIFVTLWAAYWRHGRHPVRDTEHVTIPIYRIRNIPTQHMLDNNMSKWSAGWDPTSTDVNSGLFLQDNGVPVRLDTPPSQTRTSTHARARVHLPPCRSTWRR